MQVAAYARVSSRRQAQAQTIEQQLDRLRAHAAAQGWALAPEHVFRDDGHSGASLRRPGLDRLRDAAAAARLDRILIAAPDRLARNYVHQALLVEELQGHGAVVEFLDRPMGQDPHDQLLLQIRGAVAEYERTLITERMRRGRLRKLRAGILLPWARPPYGYRVDPERPRDPAGVRLAEAEAAVVRDLFAWFVDEGASVSELARRLRGLGIASPSGLSGWCLSAVRNVLTNPVYLGQVFGNRLRARPVERRRSALRPVGRGGDSRRVTDPAEWIAVATVPAIVDHERFERAQERLAYNQRMARRNNRVHEYLLRGLVSCGHCRRACAGRHGWRGYDYYVCRTRTQPPSQPPGERCPTRHIPGRPLEELVWRDLCEVLAAPEMIVHAMERARGGTGCRRRCRRGGTIFAAPGRGCTSRSNGSRRPTSPAWCSWMSTGAAGGMPRAGCWRSMARNANSRTTPTAGPKPLVSRAMPRRSAGACGRAWSRRTSTASERCWSC
jgi:site-specific DNA recombinase